MTTETQELLASIAILIAIPIIFLPTILAFSNSRQSRWLILFFNVFLGAVGIGLLIAWVIYLVPDKDKVSKLDRASEQELSCPACGRFYDPSEYRADVPDWFCSFCKAKLPRGSTAPA